METLRLLLRSETILQNETRWGICICPVSQQSQDPNKQLGCAENRNSEQRQQILVLCKSSTFTHQKIKWNFSDLMQQERVSLIWESSEKSDFLRWVRLLEFWAPSSLRGHWVVVRSCGPCSMPFRFSSSSSTIHNPGPQFRSTTTTIGDLKWDLALTGGGQAEVTVYICRLRGEEVLLGPWNGLARVKGVGKVMEGRRRGQNWMLRSKNLPKLKLMSFNCVDKTEPRTKTLLVVLLGLCCVTSLPQLFSIPCSVLSRKIYIWGRILHKS